MAFERLSTPKLRDLYKSPAELRNYCLTRRLNTIAAFEEIERILEEREDKVKERKSARQKARESKLPKISDPGEAVIKVIREFQESGETIADLGVIASRVALDLQNRGMTHNANCPLEGFIGDFLYYLVASRKYRRKDPLVERVFIGEEELPRRLRVVLGKNAAAQIVGRVPSAYVNENYAFANDEIQFRNRETGEMVRFPNVEGTKCWDGEMKQEVRDDLSKFARKYLLSGLEERIATTNALIEKTRKDRQELKDRQRAYQEEIERLDEKERDISYTIRGSPYLIDMVVKRVLGGRRKTPGRMTQQKDEQERGHTVRELMVTFERSPGDVHAREFVDDYNAFVKSELGAGDSHKLISNIIDVNKIVESRRRERESLQAVINECEAERTRFEQLEQKLAREKSQAGNLSYLGLEGPNFGSFLKFSAVARERGFKLRGTFVEYGQRLYNLMESVAASGLCGRVLQDCDNLHGDIDDLILLDFVKDPDVRIASEGKNGNGGVAGLRATYHDEEILLERYYEVLNSLDSGQGFDETAGKYGISKEFARAVSQRKQGKFDMVFLDYVGRITDKRQRALQTLISRRIGDKTIIATTANMNPALVPIAEGTVKNIPNALFDKVVELTHAAGYRSVDMLCREYTEVGKTSPMCFQAYYLEKRKQE